jgi:Domain of unknown function (DUF4331)
MKLSILFSAVALSLGFTSIALASSHREAPMVTEMPKVDSTDVYMFKSYEAGRSNFVTILANYQPLQGPYGGPNYFYLDPEAVYEIHIDNNGNAIEDLTFQFRFKNDFRNVALNIAGENVPVPLLQVGQITGTQPDSNDAVKNLIESYSVGVIRGPRRESRPVLATNPANANSTMFRKPLDNIGPKTFTSYGAYANNHVFPIAIPGCADQGRVFVGQRQDGFLVALGEVFDLINLNPIGPRNGIQAADDVGDSNVTTIAMELPISCITAGTETVIGAWTTASLPRARVLNAFPAGTALVPNSMGLPGAVEAGALVQVSRLGTPLVNELIIGIGDKDRFSASEPKNDGQFAKYVTNPTLPALIQVLFGTAGVQAPNLFPRTDLVAAALTGIPTLNQPAGVVGSEMLRLNTATPVTAMAMQNSLGVLGGDAAGFPNGRRPGDDVVDSLLRVAMGVLLTPAQAPSGQLPYTDGVEVNATQFLNVFPYLNTPLAGN